MRHYHEKKTVLLVDDDPQISAMTGSYLEHAGYEVDYAHDGVEGLRLATEQHYDVVVLDGKMPRMDGLEVCRRFRSGARRGASILFLSGRGSVEDRVAGIEAGADDYLVKPFAMLELSARLGALVKRRRRQIAGTVLQVGDLVMDTASYEVKRSEQVLNLSPIQFQILSYLMRESPAIVSRSNIEREIWAGDLPDSDTLRSHIYSLRKVVDRPFSRPLLHTVQGFGFRVAVKERVEARNALADSKRHRMSAQLATSA